MLNEISHASNESGGDSKLNSATKYSGPRHLRMPCGCRSVESLLSLKLYLGHRATRLTINVSTVMSMITGEECSYISGFIP